MQMVGLKERPASARDTSEDASSNPSTLVEIFIFSLPTTMLEAKKIICLLEQAFKTTADPEPTTSLRTSPKTDNHSDATYETPVDPAPFGSNDAPVPETPPKSKHRKQKQKREVPPNLSTKRALDPEALFLATTKRFATLTPEEINGLPKDLRPGHEPHCTEAGTLVRHLPRRVRQSLLKQLGAYCSELVRPCFDTKSAESGQPVEPSYCLTIRTDEESYVFHAGVENGCFRVHEFVRAELPVWLLKKFLRGQRPLFRHLTAFFGRTPEERRALLDIVEAQKLHGDQMVSVPVHLEQKVRAPRTTSQLRNEVHHHRTLLAAIDLELELFLGREPDSKHDRTAIDLFDNLSTAKPKSDKGYVTAFAKKEDSDK